MIKSLALELSQVTEKAAIATYPEIGKGDKEKADQKAVDAMKDVLEKLAISGEVVIGEGEIDEAPMLYIGQKVGKGGIEVDIAVDPIDGTRMVALGQDNAVAVMVFAKKGSLLKAPDMYMEKIMVSKKAKGAIDINKTIKENVLALSKKLNKPLDQIKVMTLAKPRHEKNIKLLQSLGVKVVAIPDGDVEGSILVAMPDRDIDMFYGIGGAPEGVISAAIVKSLGGDMQARLLFRDQAKGYTKKNKKCAEDERHRCEKLSIEVGKKIHIDELCSTDNLVVSMTGITDGTLLQGVKATSKYIQTETLLIIGDQKVVKKIKTKIQI